MYAISLIGRHKMLFFKSSTLRDAKESANEELKTGAFLYAEIYDQEDAVSIRKNYNGTKWEKVPPQKESVKET